MSSTTDGSSADSGNSGCSVSYNATYLQSSQEAETVAAEVSRNQSPPWTCLRWTCSTTAPLNAGEYEMTPKHPWASSQNSEGERG